MTADVDGMLMELAVECGLADNQPRVSIPINPALRKVKHPFTDSVFVHGGARTGAAAV